MLYINTMNLLYITLIFSLLLLECFPLIDYASPLLFMTFSTIFLCFGLVFLSLFFCLFFSFRFLSRLRSDTSNLRNIGLSFFVFFRINQLDLILDALWTRTYFSFLGLNIHVLCL